MQGRSIPYMPLVMMNLIELLGIKVMEKKSACHFCSCALITFNKTTIIPWPIQHMFVKLFIYFKDFIFTNDIFPNIPLDYLFYSRKNNYKKYN